MSSARLREAVFEALKNQEGGAVGYLSRQAVEEPRAFMALIGKLLPTQITGEDGEPVRITQIELVPLVATQKPDEATD
jgi:hypothetical protein